MRSEFLDVAAALSRAIARSAVWWEGRCNWVGATVLGPRDAGRAHAAHEALGPGVYGGTAGIAVFLAEAATVLGDRAARATALGALAHARRHVDRAWPDGLYAGRLGVAYATARVARRLGDERAREHALELVQARRPAGPGSPRLDVDGGAAGSLLALLALAELLDDAALVEPALALGDGLLAAAEDGPRGASWPRPDARSEHNLCGYLHGAAGIAHALLELFAATGERRFRDAAMRAFAYERAWLDRDAEDWADLRGVERAADPEAPVPTSWFWCHGAPGIALARVRALELVESADVRADAAVAVRSTERHAAALLSEPSEDFCLCHGAAGAGDILLSTSPRSATPEAIGRLGVERHHRSRQGFPCSRPEGLTPGLLRGLAGIGLFYLRLVDRDVGSALLVTPLTAAPGGP